MATKIRLKRMGKKFYAFYRVVIMDSRTKRDGRAIEEIGTYNPNTQPSTIVIDSERAQYWLGVGAQPTEQVLNLLKITGDWQKFKGLDGAEGTLKTVEAGPDAAARVEAVEAQAQKLKAAKSEADAKAKAEAEAAATEEAPARTSSISPMTFRSSPTRTCAANSFACASTRKTSVASSDAADARQMRFAPWCRHCPTTRCASTSWTCAGEILAWCVICILTTLNSPSC